MYRLNINKTNLKLEVFIFRAIPKLTFFNGTNVEEFGHQVKFLPFVNGTNGVYQTTITLVTDINHKVDPRHHEFDICLNVAELAL